MKPLHINDVHQRHVGVFSKTVIRSPATRWLLHAQIRQQDCNDVVFVGPDFIHVKEVDAKGHLVHIATKDDFRAPIRAARVFDNRSSSLDFDEVIKRETTHASSPSKVTLPPHLLVLTLGFPLNDLVFVYLAEDQDGRSRFVQHGLPLPTFDRTLYQPGEFLAIEPQSRAIAVAALEREITLYSIRGQERSKEDLHVRSATWCPVATERSLRIDGAVQHMEFLMPPDNDTDHIILLIVVTDQRRTKALRIDWYSGSPLSDVHIHAGQPFEFGRTVSSILVPLRNAAFLMTAGGNDFYHFTDILSGPVKASTFSVLDNIEPRYPGHSSRFPCWTSWCRPSRGTTREAETESLYLVREDGIVCHLDVSSHGTAFTPTYAGDLKCHVGSSIASLDDTVLPDILAVAGDMCGGWVVSIGPFPSKGHRMPDSSYQEALSMKQVQSIPNWASTRDMLVSALPQFEGRSPRPRDGIFVTSGRQPYGAITELRQGFEAQVTSSTDDASLSFLRSVTDVWSLPTGDGTLLIILSTPTSTVLLDFTDLQDGPSLLDEDEASALDLTSRTLAAGVTRNRQLIQVTEGYICVTTRLVENFEDSVKVQCMDESIIAAAIEPEVATLVTVERKGSGSTLHVYLIPEECGDLAPATVIPLMHLPLAIAITRHKDGAIVAVASTDLLLHLIRIDSQGVGQTLGESELPADLEGQGVCDSLIILRSPTASTYLIVCGLRDGRIHSIAMDLGMDDIPTLRTSSTIQFGQSAVKLTQLVNDSTVCAISGSDCCLVSWDDETSQSLSVQSICITDRSRPSLLPGVVAACSQIPGRPFSDFFNANLRKDVEMGDMITIVLPGELMIASLDSSSSTVPRQMPVNGSPDRLIYAASHRCLVCSSQRTQIHTSLTSPSQPNKRQIFPSIEFVSARGRTDLLPPTYDMGPDEEAFALADWSHVGQNGKTYSFILVGGGHTSSTDRHRKKGRLTFLQPHLVNWEVASVKVANVIAFEDPVYALEAYDDMTFVVCHGVSISLYRFLPTEHRWESICPALPLAHRAHSITVSPPLISISTVGDSLVTLRLDQNRDLPRLVPHHNAPGAAATLSHAVVSLHDPSDSSSFDIALVPTSYRQLIGLTPPSPRPLDDPSALPQLADILFEANLPVSLTKIRPGNIRPSWREASPVGLLTDNLVGTATNGAIIGLALLDFPLWRRLAWLQNLCEWSPMLSPHTWTRPAYDATETADARFERLVPAGLAASSSSRGDTIATRTARTEAETMHIDGDVLGRLLQAGGAEMLRTSMRDLVKRREDRAGAWLAAHLEEELAAVDGMVEIVRRLADRWT